MSFIYLPGASDKDRVRFRIGDTDDTDKLLQDEEINDLLLSYSLPVATVKACYAAAATLARMVNQSISGTVGGGSSNRGSRFTNLITLAGILEKEAGGMSTIAPAIAPAIAPFVGGISQAGKDTRTGNTDAVVPAFTRTLFKSDISGA